VNYQTTNNGTHLGIVNTSYTSERHIKDFAFRLGGMNAPGWMVPMAAAE